MKQKDSVSGVRGEQSAVQQRREFANVSHPPPWNTAGGGGGVGERKGPVTGCLTPLGICDEAEWG